VIGRRQVAQPVTEYGFPGDKPELRSGKRVGRRGQPLAIFGGVDKPDRRQFKRLLAALLDQRYALGFLS